jgi:hypothetical protein
MKDPETETSRRFRTSRLEEKIRCGAEPALSERSESNGRLLEVGVRTEEIRASLDWPLPTASALAPCTLRNPPDDH